MYVRVVLRRVCTPEEVSVVVSAGNSGSPVSVAVAHSLETALIQFKTSFWSPFHMASCYLLVLKIKSMTFSE